MNITAYKVIYNHNNDPSYVFIVYIVNIRMRLTKEYRNCSTTGSSLGTDKLVCPT